MYEVKILKQITYLPSVFMLKHRNGQVTKVSLVSDDYADCSKYISRSGLTFKGCFTYKNNELVETRGIYYTPVASLLSVYGRGKISRDMDNMKRLITETLSSYGLTGQELLIVYDNYNIEFFDKFIKGQLFEFNLTFNQGNLEVYEVPPPKNPDSLCFNHVNSLTIYNHQVEFSSPTLALDFYSAPGVVFFIHPQNDVTVSMKSPDHGETKITLNSGRYYIITHPRPVNNKSD
jgi:hypothetical protein